MPKDVFISYANQDKQVADAICSALESKGIECWIGPRDILPGMNYAEALIHAIDESKIMVLVFSYNANNSPHVLREVERAVHSNISIIPFRIDETKPSEGVAYLVTTPQWLDASKPPLEKHFDLLALAIWHHLGVDTQKGDTSKEDKSSEISDRTSGSEEPTSSVSPTSGPNENIPPPKSSDKINEQTRLLRDAPVSLDQLGRKDFAEDLAIRFSRLWKETGETEYGQSFIVHLYSHWGSGKTSFLIMLKEALTPKKDSSLTSEKKLNWIVVPFNAWQNQYIDPPWWPLFDTIYNEAAKKKAGFPGGLKIRFEEKVWRLLSGQAIYSILAFCISFGVFLSLIYWMFLTGFSGNTLNQIQIISTIFTIIGMIWAGTQTFTGSLISGSADSAQTYLRMSQDPMMNVRNHFQKFVKSLEWPLIIFIDDLDRCQPKYVVQLLESIQTILNHPKVFYVVAAERRWLNVSFQKEYEILSEEIKEPGRKMCDLFLEKIFQLSITLPRIPEELLFNYWKGLLRSAAAAENPESSQRVFEDLPKKDETTTTLTSTSPLSPIRLDSKIWENQHRRGEVVLSLAKREIEPGTIHFLQRFDDLIDPNPRWMKRVVTAYSIYRDQLILSGITDLMPDESEIHDWLRHQLALWTIIQLRWPCLADYLEIHPKHLEIFLNPIDDEIKKIEEKEIREIAKEKIALRVLKGVDNVSLTTYGIEVLSGKKIFDPDDIPKSTEVPSTS
jgi:hypothetical protein